VAVGHVLISGGVATAPAWSGATIPITGQTILTAQATNAAALVVTGGSTIGAHADSGQILIGGSSTIRAAITFDRTSTITYFDATYDGATAQAMRFRLRTAGTAVTPLSLGSDVVAATIMAPSTSLPGLLVTNGAAGFTANANSGQIYLGGDASLRGMLTYDRANGLLDFSNTYDNAAGSIAFRLRTAGTPLTVVSLAGTSLSLRTVTAGETTGVWAGSYALVRFFQAAAGAGGQSVGQNFFTGHAGNSTMTNGAGVTSLASYNTAGGWTAGAALTTGSYNVLWGHSAGTALTTGQGNTLVGMYAGATNSTNGATTAVGMYAAWKNTADNTTAVGYAALMDSTTGAANTAVGPYALSDNTTGYDNTAVGYHSLKLSVLAHANTALGSDAMSAYLGSDANDGSNTAVGYHALLAQKEGRYNTAVGSFALVALVATTIGTGWSNTAIGHASLYGLTLGVRNTALGDYSLEGLATGDRNVAIGWHAGGYETGSDAFYVDDRDRTNTAGDKAGALLYGTFNDTPASQTLTINAAVTIAQALTLPGGVVTYGADDSAGAGYRWLRVPNAV
jgi:hypothetical protein